MPVSLAKRKGSPMHEMTCPSCSAPSQYDLRDYLYLCSFCSATFSLNKDTGTKEVFGEHFVVANTTDARQIRDMVREWLRRLHHSTTAVDQEFSILEIAGFSVPFWVISLEAHSAWKGLVQRQSSVRIEGGGHGNHIIEQGQFRRSYRWCISARENICEHWGMSRLHEPKEKIFVDWDGFPLDSTFSRGRLDEIAGTKESVTGERIDVPAYDVKEFFEFKYANGLPILGIQIDEDEAMRRAQTQVQQYHFELAKLYTDIHVDHRTELEIAGLQLIHLPFWFAKYAYQPKNFLRHFQKPRECHVILEGFALGVLKGELAVKRKDKLWVNAVVCGIFAIVMFLLGAVWHPSFFLVSLFCLAVSAVSAFTAMSRESTNSGDNRAANQQSFNSSAKVAHG
jgi:hypothetical protein